MCRVIAFCTNVVTSRDPALASRALLLYSAVHHSAVTPESIKLLLSERFELSDESQPNVDT